MSSVGAITTQAIDPNALRETLMSSRNNLASQAQAAGTQFEAIFVRQFIGDALKPMIKGSVDEGGSTNDTYRYMLSDLLAQNLASRGVFGIGKQVADQMVAKQAAQAASLPSSGPVSSSADLKAALVGTPTAKNLLTKK